MSDAIDAMRKAQEERFFKLEQEKHLMAYIKKLKAEGRYDSIPAPVARDLSSSALPQVMAHSLRLSQPTVDTHMRRELDRSFLSRHVVKGVCTGDPYLISSMTMGSRVSLGKNKWSAGRVRDTSSWTAYGQRNSCSRHPSRHSKSSHGLHQEMPTLLQRSQRLSLNVGILSSLP